MTTAFDDIIDYMEALSAILRHEQRALATSQQLQPVHLQIINYLGRCNRYSDSLQVLCEYLGQTKGSVSTSVALLESKGLLHKHKDPHDGRKVHLILTAEGSKLYAQQFDSWRNVLAAMQDAQKSAIKDSLEHLLASLQTANQHKLFGACRSCRHLVEEGKMYRCGLTQETLHAEELEKICVYHEA